MFYANAAIYFYGYGGYIWSSNCDPWFPLTLAGQNSDAQIGCGVQSGARVEFSPISNFNGEDPNQNWLLIADNAGINAEIEWDFTLTVTYTVPTFTSRW